MSPAPAPPADAILGWLHVLGLGVLLGATALAWAVHRTDRVELPAPVALQLAATYEAVFWAGAGLLVVAAVGRVGAVLGVRTAGWPGLGLYLLALLVLLAGSLIRSLGVVELRRGSLPDTPGPLLARLRRSYATTAVVLVIVALLAEVAAGG